MLPLALAPGATAAAAAAALELTACCTRGSNTQMETLERNGNKCKQEKQLHHSFKAHLRSGSMGWWQRARMRRFGAGISVAA